MKRLSIIIVTYNSEKDIYDCISSIIKHADIPMPELEVIIVDNNSKDSDKMFSKITDIYGDDIVLIKNTRNGGYGQGNNVGIRRATAPVILIMNPDVRLATPIFKTAAEAFENNHQLCIYGMKQMLTPTQPSSSSFNCTYMMNGYISTLLTGLSNRLDWYIPRYMHFSGSCFFIRKAFFEKIGLFDESNFMYGEEDDLHYRLRKAGYKTMKYNANLKYIHLVKDRKPNLEYELKLIDVAVRQNEKKGYPAYKTVKNRLRNAKILLIREYLHIKMGKQDTTLYLMLKDLIANLRQYKYTKNI
ncbi:MAG: glycosyltransferase family 2 protein [Prevotella sp.]|nr:glycosyltransferase family 2 protein [Prevotella sp.]